MMLADHISASFGVLRAHKSTEELAEKGDYYGLYAQKSADMVPETFYSPIGQRLAYAALFAAVLPVGLMYFGSEYARGRIVSSGPVDLHIHKECISAHYLGDKESLKNLDQHLGDVARKLFAKSGSLPDKIFATSSRDMLAVITRMYGMKMKKVNNYVSADEVLAIADSARLVRGRGPCPDRNIYSISMPTEEFIDRFAFPSQHRGQNY